MGYWNVHFIYIFERCSKKASCNYGWLICSIYQRKTKRKERNKNNHVKLLVLEKLPICDNTTKKILSKSSFIVLYNREEIKLTWKNLIHLDCCLCQDS
jgi:hypothetical protein